MLKDFVISDLHFGHALMLRPDVCNRPYENMDEMNAAMIAAWNDTVSHEDTVYVLGDVVMKMQDRDVKRILAQLQGHKILVRGNHDQDYLVTMKGIWDEVHFYLELPSTPERPHVILFHFPIEEWNRMHHGAVHLHGHCHGRSRPMRNRYDVGADVVGMAPITLLEAVRRAQSVCPDETQAAGIGMRS